MSKRANIWITIKIAVLFFVLTFIMQYVIDVFDSYRNGLGLPIPKIDEFTFLIPLLVSAWQFITTTSTYDVIEGTREVVETLKDENDDFRKQIAKGVIEHDEHTYRTLTYKKDEGAIFNGFGDEKEVSRNVLFSNKTINHIFQEIRNTKINDPMLLHNIGKSASERFAAEMVEEIENDFGLSNVTLTDWLKKWIEFDTDAGFGKFDLEGDIINWKNNKVILLKYSFLTQHCLEDRSNNTGLCRFMSGYIEGIINSFPSEILKPYDLKPKEIIIEHNTNSEEECICAGRPRLKGCRYHITSK